MKTPNEENQNAQNENEKNETNGTPISDVTTILEKYMIGDEEFLSTEDYIAAAKKCLKYWALDPNSYEERELILIGRSYLQWGGDPTMMDRYYLPYNYKNDYEYNATRKCHRKRSYRYKYQRPDNDKHYNTDPHRAYHGL